MKQQNCGWCFSDHRNQPTIDKLAGRWAAKPAVAKALEDGGVLVTPSLKYAAKV